MDMDVHETAQGMPMLHLMGLQSLLYLERSFDVILSPRTRRDRKIPGPAPTSCLDQRIDDGIWLNCVVEGA